MQVDRPEHVAKLVRDDDGLWILGKFDGCRAFWQFAAGVRNGQGRAEGGAYR